MTDIVLMTNVTVEVVFHLVSVVLDGGICPQL